MKRVGSRKARNLEMLGEGTSIRRDSNTLKPDAAKVGDARVEKDIKPLIRNRDAKFWESEAGFDEALGLIEGYFQKNNMLPRLYEARKELGLGKFSELVADGIFLEKRGVATWNELLKKYFQGMSVKRAQQHREEWWKSKAGFEEAKKRVLEFWNKTGVIPSEKRTKFLGMVTFRRLLNQGIYKESKGVETWDGFIRIHCGLVAEKKTENIWDSEEGFGKAVALIGEFVKKHVGRMPNVTERSELGLDDFDWALKNNHFEEKFGVTSWPELQRKYFEGAELKGFWSTEEGFSVGLEKIAKFFKANGRKLSENEIIGLELGGFVGSVQRYEWLESKGIASMTEFYEKYIFDKGAGTG